MEQNYKNHSRYVAGYHIILATLLLAGLIGSIKNLIRQFETDGIYAASLLVLLFICCLLLFVFVRAFPLKAQDRAIRSEENLRHFILTGKALPSTLSVGQIVALRFSSDNEFPELAQTASKNNMPAKAIKEAIKSWKADNYRV